MLAFANARFAEDEKYTDKNSGSPVGRIVEFLPVVHARISAQVLLFRPRIGTVLTAPCALTGHDTIACMLGGLFTATLLKDDLAGGYVFDDSSSAWVATPVHEAAVRAASASNEWAEGKGEGAAQAGGKKRKREDTENDYNRLLACNPSRIVAGSLVTFRVSSVTVSEGIVTLNCTLLHEDAAMRTTAAAAAKPAPQPAGKTASAPVSIKRPGAEWTTAPGLQLDPASSAAPAKKEKKEKKERRE